MSINPQFTYDNQGNPLGVFLSMEDWKNLSDNVILDIPQWQKDETDRRLADYYANPDSAVDAEEFFNNLMKEDSDGV